MDSNTKTQLDKALQEMRVQDAIKLIAAQMEPVSRVAFFADLQTVTTPAAQVHVCLQHIQAVQS